MAEPPAQAQGARRPSTPRERMERGYAKAEERNQEAREALEPLAEGERPLVVTIGAIVAGLIALSIVDRLPRRRQGQRRETAPRPGPGAGAADGGHGLGHVARPLLGRARLPADPRLPDLQRRLRPRRAGRDASASSPPPSACSPSPAPSSSSWSRRWRGSRCPTARVGSGLFYRLGTMADSFDVIVIGGGPGGYVAAIRAAQLGKKTAVVERDKAGGRCLNYACIPAKTVLRTAEIYDQARESAELGVVAKDVSIDWDALGKRRAAVSESLSGGVKMLWDKNKIDRDRGRGLADRRGQRQGRRRGLRGRRGRPRHRLGRAADPRGRVRRPRRRHLGRLVAARAAEEDRRRRRRRLGLGDRLRLRPLRHRGAADRDARPDPPRRGQGHGPGGRARLQEAEHHDLHRHPGRERRGRRELGQVHLRRRDGRGRLPLHRRRPRARRRGPRASRRPGSSWPRTARSRSTSSSAPRTPRSTRSATWSTPRRSPTRPPRRASSRSSTRPAAETHPVDQNLVAGATFCHPQVASVGLTEAAAKEAGHDVKVGKQKLGGVGGATVYDDKDGLVKLVVDSKYGEILGAHIVGNRACDMIAELVATMALEGGYQELARIVHPHPTISEAISEAARAVDGWAIHA